MCGIIGTVDLPIDQAALDLIAHRGPDGQGLTTRTLGVHRVVFGHRRLAIVDLSANGAQPMASSDDAHLVTFNGEIYNHLELRRQIRGIAFRGHSDTETLLYSLAARGTAAIGDLNGIFAFAWLDLQRRRLVLVRDPFGVKPLYYARVGAGLVFASEIKPLLQLVPKQVDRRRLATLLKLRYSPSPDTLFEDIHRLRPGHFLDIDLAGESLRVSEVAYRGTVTQAAERVGLDSAVQRYGDLFTAAVERQLMSDVEVGVLLSGGVDSALVAAVARKALDKPIKAFTVGFTGAEAAGVDEVDDARHTAGQLGLDHHVVRIGSDGFIEALRECVRIVEEPLATTSIVPMRFLAQLAARHVKVVLSGQGADEPLGGYGRYQGALLSRYVPRWLAQAGGGVAGALGLRNDQLRRGLAALAQPDEIGRLCETYAVFTDEEITALTGTAVTDAKARIRYFHDLLGCAALPDEAARMMALDLRLNLADDLLLYTDKITMASSLECRVPILDLDLVRYLESLPVEYRVTLRQRKRVHKLFAREYLPAAIIERPKKGFWSPTARWFRDSRAIHDLLLQPDSRFAGFLDRQAVARTLEQHRRGHNRERHIFLLLCLFFWFEEFG